MGFTAEIEMLRNHLLEQGYSPLSCVESGTVDSREGKILVVHFSYQSPSLPGEEHLIYIDTPSTIAVMLNLRSGKITIPEMM